MAESVAVGGVTPVPVSDTDCGLSAASSVMFTVAARAPVAAGVKLTPIVQLVPGATEPAPVGQVLPAAKAKSAACAPVMVMLVRLSGAASLLVSVTFCPALVAIGQTRCGESNGWDRAGAAQRDRLRAARGIISNVHGSGASAGGRRSERQREGATGRRSHRSASEWTGRRARAGHSKVTWARARPGDAGEVERGCAAVGQGDR